MGLYKLIAFTLQMRITPNAKCQQVLVLALWLVVAIEHIATSPRTPVSHGKLLEFVAICRFLMQS